VTTWLIHYKWGRRPVAEAVARYRKAIAELEGMLPEALPGSYRQEWDQAVEGMKDDGVPEKEAKLLANTMVLGCAPDIVELASLAQVPLKLAAEVYFLVGDKLQILWLLSSILDLSVQDRWQALARANLREDSYRLHRQVAAKVLSMRVTTPPHALPPGKKNPVARSPSAFTVCRPCRQMVPTTS
jgi:glutamate dehydrogenase